MSEQGQDYSMKEPLEEKGMENSEKSDDDIFHPSIQTYTLTEFLEKRNGCVFWNI